MAKNAKHTATSRVIGRRSLAALSVTALTLGALSSGTGAVPFNTLAYANAQEATQPGAATATQATPFQNPTFWDYPEKYRIKTTAIYSTGVNYSRIIDDKTLAADLHYRTLSNPGAYGIDWIYLHIDPALAPYIDGIDVIAEGIAPQAHYTRYFEPVTPTTRAEVNAGGHESGPIDPYAEQVKKHPNTVWRVLNTYFAWKGPAPAFRKNKFFRGGFTGNWGLFSDVAIQDQYFTGEMTIHLKDTVENIRKKTNQTRFPIEVRWEGTRGSKDSHPETIIERSSDGKGTIIDLSDQFKGITAQKTVWAQAALFGQMTLGQIPGLIQTDGNFYPVDGDLSVMRQIIYRNHAIGSYNGAAQKPFDFNIQIDPGVLKSAVAPVRVWKRFSGHAWKRGADDKPVFVPLNLFDKTGKVRITDDQSQKGNPHTLVIDRLTRVYEGNALNPVVDATVVEVPIEESKLVATYSDPKWSRETWTRVWSSKPQKGNKDVLIRHSDLYTYWRMWVTKQPQVQNLSQLSGDTDKLTDTKDTVRESQNFLQGTAEPNAVVSVFRELPIDDPRNEEEAPPQAPGSEPAPKPTKPRKQLIGYAQADDSGNWIAKLCRPKDFSREDQGAGCEAMSLRDLGVTSDYGKLLVSARWENNAASEFKQITVTKVKTNKPTTQYTNDAPLGKKTTTLTGTIGDKHLHATKTKVYAYIKGKDNALEKIGESAPVEGNTADTKTFTITNLDTKKLESCPNIILRAEEHTHFDHGRYTKAANEAKDDAYAASDNVTVPVCVSKTVTFDLNGGQAPAGTTLDPVVVVQGDAIGDQYPATNPTRDGYTFAGWATTTGAATPDFTNETVINDNITVHALWTPTAATKWNTDHGKDGALATVPTAFDYGHKVTADETKKLIKDSGSLPAGATVTADPAIDTSPTDTKNRVQHPTVTITFADGSKAKGPVAVTVRPAKPAITTANGTTVAGTAAPGDRVTISYTDEKDQPRTVDTVTVGDNGKWSHTFPAGQKPKNGGTLTVQTKDPKTNERSPKVTTNVDSQGPSITPDKTDGKTVSGTVTGTDKVTITYFDKKGNSHPVEVPVTGGKFTGTIPNADINKPITVKGTDAAGNPTSVAVELNDALKWAKEHGNNGALTTVPATFDHGHTITAADKKKLVKDSQTLPQGAKVTVAPDINTNPAAAAGRVQNPTVTVTFPDGSTTTGPVKVTIAPEAPTITTINGTKVAGTAHAGDTITIEYTNNANRKKTVPNVSVKTDGTWEYTFPDGQGPKNNTQLSVQAKDGKTNALSPKVSQRVDAKGPSITPDDSDGKTVSGSATGTDKVTITYVDKKGNSHPVEVPVTGGKFNKVIDNADPSKPIYVEGTDDSGNTTRVEVPLNNQATNWVNEHGEDGALATVPAVFAHGHTVTPAETKKLVKHSDTLPADATVTVTPAINTTPTTTAARVQNPTVTVTFGDGSTLTKPVKVTVRPESPVVNVASGAKVTGTATTGDTITVSYTDGSGAKQSPENIAVNADGTWEYTFPAGHGPKNGSTLTAKAKDGATGEYSPEVPKTINAKGPQITPDISDGLTVSGKADGTDKVTVIYTDKKGNEHKVEVPVTGGKFNTKIENADPTKGITVEGIDANGNKTEAKVTVHADTTAPEKPVLHGPVKGNAGDEITVTNAEPGSTVTLTDASGKVVGQKKVTSKDGVVKISLTAQVPEGPDALRATVTDPSGNDSEKATTAVDRTAPETPTLNPTAGGTLSGQVEQGATPTIVYDNNGTRVQVPSDQVTINKDGTFTATFVPRLPNNTKIYVTATDAAGNVSPEASTSVDTSLVDKPNVKGPVKGNAGDEISVTGVAPGATVTLTDGTTGKVVGTRTADAKGTVSITLTGDVTEGKGTLVATAMAAGNKSQPTKIDVDRTPPVKPTVAVNDKGTRITGTVEEGSTPTITYTDADGKSHTVTGDQIVVNPDGSFEFAPPTPAKPGSTIKVTTTDAAGNESPAGTATVPEATTVPAPTDVEATSTVVRGVGVPGSTVIVRDGSGVELGRDTVHDDGSFKVTIPAQPDGSTLTVVQAKDEEESDPVSVTVTQTPLTDLTISSDGTVVTGVTVPGSDVTITLPDGSVIRGKADENGHFSINIPKLSDGDTIRVKVTTPDGETITKDVTFHGPAAGSASSSGSSGSSDTDLAIVGGVLGAAALGGIAMGVLNNTHNAAPAVPQEHHEAPAPQGKGIPKTEQPNAHHDAHASEARSGLLAVTGADGTPLWLGGLLSALAGAWLFVTKRRRKGQE